MKIKDEPHYVITDVKRMSPEEVRRCNNLLAKMLLKKIVVTTAVVATACYFANKLDKDENEQPTEEN